MLDNGTYLTFAELIISPRTQIIKPFLLPRMQICMVYFGHTNLLLEITHMVKKIIALNEYISAHDAAQLLSAKHGRPISPKYIRSLSKRKKNPVRTQEMSNRLLYNRADIEMVSIKQKQKEKHP